MLWNKRKPTEPGRAAASAPDRSGYRVAEPDRALSAVGTMLDAFGRFAFDTDLAAGLVREQCEHWARRIMLGEPAARGADDAEPAGTVSADAALESADDRAGGAAADPATGAPRGVIRDWRGVERFFLDQRKREGQFVERAMGALRRTVLSLGRALSDSLGDDRETDGVVEERIEALARAVVHGDVSSIIQSANAAVETTRAALGKRRERQARQATKLDKELRELRDALGGDSQRGGVDELTGLYSRGAYEQQLEQLCALGGLLEQPPWLVLIEVHAGKGDASRRPNERRPVPDTTLRSASHSVSRTFLRRHDFAARSGANEISVFVVDMTQQEVNAAAERLLVDIYNGGRSLARGESPSVTIGVARLRANDDIGGWRARADLALQRAREDGGECHRMVL